MLKNPPADAGDAGSIPGLERSSRGGNGNPTHYFCLGNPMDRGAWWAIVHGVAKSLDTTEPLTNRPKKMDPQEGPWQSKNVVFLKSKTIWARFWKAVAASACQLAPRFRR